MTFATSKIFVLHTCLKHALHAQAPGKLVCKHAIVTLVSEFTQTYICL